MYRFWDSITRPLLEILQPATVAEIGVYEGKQTELLLRFAREHDAVVHAIDPEVIFPLAAFEEEFAEQWRFHRTTSIEAIPTMPLCDVYLIDGDHNWYTVYRELMLLEEKAEREGRFPVVLFHDTSWPYARRDMYYDPERIPAFYRKPYAQQGIIAGENGLFDDAGMNMSNFNALDEGTAQNGVLTAIEDFLRRTTLDLRFVTVAGGHGLGILVPKKVLDEKKELTGFLDELKTGKHIRAHLDRLDQDHVNTGIHLLKVERALGESAEQIRILKGQMNELKEINVELAGSLAHLKRTRSWKWTQPMRDVEEALKAAEKRGIPGKMIALLNALWILCGRPFSGPIRRFRHGVLGAVVPAKPAENVVQPVSPADETPKLLYGIDMFIYEGNEMLLRQTLESIARQTVRPAKVIYLQTTARPLPEGCTDIVANLRIRPLHEVETVMDAVGAEMKSNFVILIESGNTLSPDYIRKGCDVLNKRKDAAIAAGDCFMPHSQETKRTSTDVSPVVRNSIVFKALLREHIRDIPRLWHLITDGGAIVVPTDETVTVYDGSVEALGDQPDPIDTTLCIALSGRTWMWPHTRAFLERQSYDKKRIHLIVMDTSQNTAFAEEVETWVTQSAFGKKTFLREKVGEPGIADKPRNEAGPAVTDACVKIYNAFSLLTTTPIVLILEDDVIPPDDAFVRLAKNLRPDVLSVSGVYRHRLVPEIVAWNWSPEGKPVASVLKTGVQPIGGNGFGCVAMQGDYFASTVIGGDAPLFNFDFNFYFHAVLVEQRTALIDWDCRCKHYVHAEHWVTPL